MTTLAQSLISGKERQVKLSTAFLNKFTFKGGMLEDLKAIQEKGYVAKGNTVYKLMLVDEKSLKRDVIKSVSPYKSFS